MVPAAALPTVTLSSPPWPLTVSTSVVFVDVDVVVAGARVEDDLHGLTGRRPHAADRDGGELVVHHEGVAGVGAVDLQEIDAVQRQGRGEGDNPAQGRASRNSVARSSSPWVTVYVWLPTVLVVDVQGVLGAGGGVEGQVVEQEAPGPDCRNRR